ncbi:SusE domain-containing protein [Cesiribacter sp. SM1]|uniref:SusF/SusE family outer membrane protein n=1 Tax=Cesiribacter sp. SM1 TaxID=2861196 RepID=UPI001CD5E22F|nr:SusE domain-containing protein [Cesiribacter sp. SM1]
MKKLHLYTYLLIMLAVVWSCEEKDNLDPIGNWELSTPAIISPADNTTIVLDETVPTTPVRFEWGPAESSKGYGVKYFFVLDSANSEDFSTPIMRVASADNGKGLFVTPTARQIDQALSMAGYEAGTTINLKWGVIAQSLSKEAVVSQPIAITRFLTESAPLTLYISGAATEKGADVTQAIAMKAFKDADGNPANIFEIYTSLKAGEGFKFYSQPAAQSMVYGGANGQLVKNGEAITATEAGQYRITVNFENNTYNLLKIDKWSVVGDIIEGGWGGDAPLQYKGNSVWQGSINVVKPAGYVFRANGDWAYLLKWIEGSSNELVMESQAAAQGIEFDDIQFTEEAGKYLFTLNLAAGKYTYTIEEDNSTEEPAETPETLFLLSDGAVVAELNKNGDSFTTANFLALEASKTYSLNTAEDGSGDSYTLETPIGETGNTGGDAVTGNAVLLSGNDAISVARDQAYQLTFNFADGSLAWKHYNIKLFHWEDADGGWDTRNEFLMTYVHPYKYEVTTDLSANYAMKFNSPWDVEMGADDPAALTGTMTNKGGSNFKNITESGNYKVTIEVAPDYATGTYTFVKQ